ncbi:hypothetical protein MO973_06720 [Paenibacillus sp. TRM 82003]|nr:hypothetical protein [Paenibacillus sp. TRM 82003]
MKHLPISNFTIRYYENGDWGESETYKDISPDAPIVKLIRTMNEGNYGVLPETGLKFYLVSVVYDVPLDELLYYENKELPKLEDSTILGIAEKLPLAIGNYITVPRNAKLLAQKCIAVKLNYEDIKQCISWLESLSNAGVFVEDILIKLRLIEKTQGKIEIQDIRRVRTLHSIEDLYRELEATKKCKVILQRCIELGYSKDITYTRMGKIYRLENDYLNAILSYKKSLEIKDHPIPYNGLGAIYSDLGQFEDALYCYHNALNHDEEHDVKVTHTGLGAVYFAMGEYEKGRNHFLQSGCSESYFMGMYEKAKKEKKVDKSIECLRLILTINDKNTKVKKMLEDELNIMNLFNTIDK